MLMLIAFKMESWFGEGEERSLIADISVPILVEVGGMCVELQHGMLKYILGIPHLL